MQALFRLFIVITTALVVYTVMTIDLSAMEAAKGSPLTSEDELVAFLVRFVIVLIILYIGDL